MRHVDAPSEVAGRYVIAGRIGSGGMGDVFRARDSVLGRTIAIKMLPFELAIQPGFVERFKAEAQSVARISHPNVVQVHDWGQENDTYYMVMEYVRGKNLRQVLSHTKRLPPRQAAQVTGQVLGALAAAHEKGVIHRDIKPENVVVATDGRVKVADFGIARAVENAALTGGMLGTVAYVAPEQAWGERVDPRADLYSTGCMLYELLTGSLPFEGDAAKVLQDHLNSRVPAPSTLVPEVGEILDRIVTKATAPRAADRYQSASEMRKDLALAVAGLPEAPPLTELTGEFTSEAGPENVETVVRHAPVKKKKSWKRWTLLAVVMLALVGGIYLGPTQVPPLAGETRAVAEERIREAGLQAGFTEAFSDDVPAGEVITSRPSAGSWTRKGGSVAVTLSRGPKLSDVPNVVGMQLEQARAEIIENDLAISPNIERRNSIEPVDKVLSQDPPPKQVKSGELVTLVVSDGPAILPIPNLGGKSGDGAEKELRDLGFVPVTESVFNGAASGTVVGQTPPAGEPHPQGTEVKVSVSKGPQPFKVPDVKGKSCAEAKAALEGLGMKVSAQTSGGGPATCAGNQVLEQDPLAGSDRRPGSEATLYVG
ncbi:Stk1 family PASTA domain-containing Ser/Thr kinase [soil metagenome]